MAAQTLVPKGPTVTKEFDRDRLLRELFSLPVPPQNRKGRKPHPIHLPLGRIMALKDITPRELCAMNMDMPNTRVLTEYLAGRKPISPKHRVVLAAGLGVDARLL